LEEGAAVSFIFIKTIFFMTPYKALALQTHCTAINNIEPANWKAHRMSAIERVCQQIDASKKFIGNDLKLVVLPEYFTTGYPAGESIEEWQQKACVEMEGEEYALMQAHAKKMSVYISGNWYELDKNFPALYFQTSFIIDDNGKLVLRYRRLNSMYAPTPHDVLDKYIEVYGKESLFPVAKTEIGNLACIASEEILYPEIARCLALNGAEIFLHSSSEIASPMPTQKNIAKQARAIENMAYVVSANSAGIGGIAFPAESTDGHSQVVNYEGLKLCEAANGESMVANATIHIDALRHHRQRPGMGNFLSRQRFELFAEIYSQSVYPANTLLDKKVERSHFIETQKTVIAKMNKEQ
jgi:deaminated glutathione amidase